MDKIWITWENQRRSIELSKILNAKLFLLQYSGLQRYIKLTYETIKILQINRPVILFVQNPSMILTTIACIYKIIKGNILIVDRHTTFLLNKRFKYTPTLLLFIILHKLTIRIADLTIVTNEFLASIVIKLKGNPFVLPDKLPTLVGSRKIKLNGTKNVLLISSFDFDEPINEIFVAMKSFIKNKIYLYISGNYKKLYKKIIKNKPFNVILTGYLSEEDYVNILFSVDIVMVLTTADYVMLCGCYEAISAEKPLITSNKKVLKDYFKGAIFVENEAKFITLGLQEALNNTSYYQREIVKLKRLLENNWSLTFNSLEKKVSHLT